ncbi:maturation of Asn-linked oligosaccharides protein [Ceratobasidium sp. 370]|nr:maturation of Asn-linked oligosaccharides protein [Ceratobasidium sp. 370]
MGHPRSDAPANAQRVVDMFKSAYGNYRAFAWGHDSLAPLLGEFIDDRNGWGATIVDSLSTMQVMGLEDLVKEAVNFTVNIDFGQSNTDDTVSLFESTIRYVGGILSAYELGGKKDTRLIEKARELADKLIHGWVGDNDIPYNELDFSSNQPVIKETGMAVAGTLVLEWARLSDYTRNETYRAYAEKAMRRIGLLVRYE